MFPFFLFWLQGSEKKIAPKIRATFLFSGYFQLVVLGRYNKLVSGETSTLWLFLPAVPILYWTDLGEGSLLGSGIRAILIFGSRNILFRVSTLSFLDFRACLNSSKLFKQFWTIYMCYLYRSYFFGFVLLLEQSISSFRAKYFFFLWKKFCSLYRRGGKGEYERGEKMIHFHSFSSFSSYYWNLYYELHKEGDIDRTPIFLLGPKNHLFLPKDTNVVRRGWEYNSEKFGVYSLDSARRHASHGAIYLKAVWDCISQEPSTISYPLTHSKYLQSSKNKTQSIEIKITLNYKVVWWGHLPQMM